MFNIRYTYFGRMEYRAERPTRGFVFEPCACFKSILTKLVFAENFNGRDNAPVMVKFKQDTYPRHPAKGAIIVNVSQYLSEQENEQLHNGVIVGDYHCCLENDRQILKDMLAKKQWTEHSAVRVRTLEEAKDPVATNMSRNIEEYQFFNYVTGKWTRSYYNFQYTPEEVRQLAV